MKPKNYSGRMAYYPSLARNQALPKLVLHPNQKDFSPRIKQDKFAKISPT